MKFLIIKGLRKAFAALMSALLALTGGIFGGEGQTEINRPTENTVTAYDAAASDYQLSIDADEEIHDISDLLFGVFFEDINFAADGGLYAELVVNRSFEFTELAMGDQLYGWQTVGGATAEVKVNDINNALNENNTNYAVLTNVTAEKAGIANRGFLDGMAVEKDAHYNFSVYAKSVGGYDSAVYVQLAVGENVVGEAKIDSITNEWQKYSLSITSSATASSGVTLRVLIDNGSVALDMVSLFPEDTFKGRENGMRKDLGELLEELEPKFLRFPGGCIIEGYNYDTAYNWKDSIGTGRNGEPLEFNGNYGDVAARKQGINLWTDIAATDDPYPSFMSYGLGFFEYFQLAEDIGAIGVPVLNCGLYCQMRGMGPVDMESEEFAQYIQDMHDLVEFCRGDANSKWGKVRASLGHEEPFELKYICIGNENENEVYFERYKAFLDSFNEAKAEKPELYKDLELIYSSGASDGTHGDNYIKSYEYAKEEIMNNYGGDVLAFAGATDQHYYNDPEWFLENTDYYDEDNYKRDASEMTDTLYGGGINVFLGEYAARSNTLKAALAEAAYMTGLERNGDIVKMAAYAPLFGNLTARHWAPDLIWFNNHQSTGSISYYMQKIFSTNAGLTLLKSTLEGAKVERAPLTGRVGVGTWYTAAEFDNINLVDNDTGRKIASDSFTAVPFWWHWEKASDGDFSIKNGKLVQSSTWMEYSNTGSVAYFGDEDWTNYTYTLEATKLDGGEGFLIPFAVKDIDNNYFWNIGGWGNTVSSLQKIENGIKTGKIIGTDKPFTVETGKTYELKVVVSGTQVKCYIDGELYVDWDFASGAEAEAYHVVSTDETGDVIVKIVNVTSSSRVVAVDVAGKDIAKSAKISQVAGESLADDNILGAKEDCIMEEFTVDGFSNQFNYTVPAYSVTCIRLSAINN